MARQSMSQLYTGDSFGRKWNTAYSAAWRMMAGSLFNLSLEDIPQESFDNLLSLVFWAVVDGEYNGKVPCQVVDTVPDRCDKGLSDVLVACSESTEPQG